MPTLTISKPNEKQEKFFIAEEKYIAYGGA